MDNVVDTVVVVVLCYGVALWRCSMLYGVGSEYLAFTLVTSYFSAKECVHFHFYLVHNGFNR